MKRLKLLIFLLLSVSLFASKGTLDEAKVRQDMINKAFELESKNMTYCLPLNGRVCPPNSIDCSHFIFETTKNVPEFKGVFGGGYATTANMRANSKYMKQLTKDQLKPGDLIVMSAGGQSNVGHVMMYLGEGSNGKIKIIDASSTAKGVKIREISYPPTRYAGTISITDVIGANGYTAVNPDGTVIIPPQGGVSTGSCVVSGGGNPMAMADGSTCRVSTEDIIKAFAPHRQDASQLAQYYETYSKASGIPAYVLIATTMQETDFIWEKTSGKIKRDGFMQVEFKSLGDVLSKDGNILTGKGLKGGELTRMQNELYKQQGQSVEIGIKLGAAELHSIYNSYIKGGKSHVSREYGEGIGSVLAYYNGGGKLDSDISYAYVVSMEQRLRGIAQACASGTISEEDKKLMRTRATKEQGRAGYKQAMENLNKNQVGAGGTMSCQNESDPEFSFLDVIFTWDDTMDFFRVQLGNGIYKVITFLEPLIPLLATLGLIYTLFLKRRESYLEIFFAMLEYLLICVTLYFLFTNWISLVYKPSEELFLRSLPAQIFEDNTLASNNGQSFGLNNFWSNSMKLPEYYFKILMDFKKTSVLATKYPALINTGSKGFWKTLTDIGVSAGNFLATTISQNTVTDVLNITTDLIKCFALVGCTLYAFIIIIQFLVNIFIAIMNFMMMVMLTSIFCLAGFFKITRDQWGLNPLTTIISTGVGVVGVIGICDIFMELATSSHINDATITFGNTTLIEILQYFIVLLLVHLVSQKALSKLVEQL